MSKLLFTVTGLFVLIVINSGSAAAQVKHESLTIVINDSDTIINGTKLSEADENERKELLEKLKGVGKHVTTGRIKDPVSATIVRRSGNDADTIIRRKGKEPHILFWNDNVKNGFRFERSPRGHIFSFDNDSLTFNMKGDSLLKHFKWDGLDSNFRDGIITMRRDLEHAFPQFRTSPSKPGTRYFFPSLGLKKNSSSFTYIYVDKDGIEDQVHISIEDPSDTQFEKITGSLQEGNTLDVKDLTLFPNMSTGTLNLTFNVKTSGNTKVRVLDSSMNEISSDSDIIVNAPYFKPLDIVRNGVYYISISQNGRWYVKRVVKE